MVRSYKRKSTKVTTYTQASLKRALEEIRRGVITQYGAHKKYNIPQMTLSYHRRGLRGNKSSTMGRTTAIPPEEEAKLAEYLITMEKWVTKRKVATGAEVITGEEVEHRIEEMQNMVKSKEQRKKQTSKKAAQEEEEEKESENEINMFNDSDDDIEEERRETEALDVCMAEMNKHSKDIEVDDWVLVSFLGKKIKKYYVGQVVSGSKEDDELEIKFTRKVPSLDPLSSSTFAWKTPDEYVIVPRDDIILSLPKPNFTGRRGLIKFEINFSAYNVQ